MNLFKYFKTARDDQDGAVTVDWVVLTAAIVVLGTGLVSVFAPDLTAASNYISSMVVATR